MSATRKNAIQRDVEAALVATGLAWEILPGSKHKKIFLDGQLVGVICRGQKSRDSKKTVARIRHYAERKRCPKES